jgi:hypothetical protein
MATFKYLAVIATAGLLSSSSTQSAVDRGSDGIQRFDQVWMVIHIDDAGREIVVQAKLTTGDYAPMIAADSARLESMMTAARELAKASNKTMRLVKFTNRVDVEEIRP